MKEFKLELKKGNKIAEKLNLVTKLFDFNNELEILELRITGVIANENYGTEKVKNQLVELKGKNIKYNGMLWESQKELTVEFFIYTR
tara:strand:+ start:791 stop:1051 length:261 start_codon:yes stop_codon:yes gene_type:complete